MKNLNVLPVVVGLLMATSLSSPVFASNGLFDFADSCIAARDGFAEKRDTILSTFGSTLEQVATATPTDGWNDAWTAQLKLRLRERFDKEVKPVLDGLGQKFDIDAAFETWYTKVMAAVPTQDLENARTMSYRDALRSYLTKKQTEANGSLNQAKATLDSKCKMDVGNQALRVALAAITAPIEVSVKNWKMGEDGGFVNQVLAVTTGVDIVDLVNTGTVSDASVVSQAGHAVEDAGHYVGDRLGIHF